MHDMQFDRILCNVFHRDRKQEQLLAASASFLENDGNNDDASLLLED